MDEFEEMSLNMELLLESQVVLDYTRVAALLNSLKTQHIAFKHNIIKNIQDVLPDIRGGVVAEQQLTDLVNMYDMSPYTERTFRNLLKTRKREIEVIDSIIEVSSILDNVKVDIDGSGEGFECGLRNQFTLHYVLHLLPYEDPDEFAQMYSDGVLPDEGDKWFNDLTISGVMGKMSTDFQKFAELNKDRSICFVISLERGAQDWHNQESNFELVMYEHGKLLKKGFRPPGQIRTDYVEELVADWDRFKLKVTHDKVEYRSKLFVNVKDVLCHESLNATKKIGMVHGTRHTEIDITGLQPSCVYEATFTIWMFSGTVLMSLKFFRLSYSGGASVFWWKSVCTTKFILDSKSNYPIQMLLCFQELMRWLSMGLQMWEGFAPMEPVLQMSLKLMKCSAAVAVRIAVGQSAFGRIPQIHAWKVSHLRLHGVKRIPAQSHQQDLTALIVAVFMLFNCIWVSLSLSVIR